MRPLAIAITLALLAGCGDGGNPSSEEGGVVPDTATVDAFASQLWTAVRSRRIALAAEYGPYAEYRSAIYGEAAYQARLRDQAASGLVFYQAALVPGCLAEVAAAADVQALYDARFDPGRPCRRAFHGSSQRGGPCVRSADCVAHTYCLLSGSCPGTCVARSGTGAACSADQNYGQCDFGFACRIGPIGSTSGTCIPARIDAGGACGTTGACLQQLRCDGITCQVPGGTGASCTVSAECRLDLTCVGGSCGPRLPSGSACTQGIDACQGGTYCDATGHCAPAPGPGEACGAVDDGGESRGCRTGSCLTGGTCQLLHDPGEPCASVDLCKYTACNPTSGSCGDGCG